MNRRGHFVHTYFRILKFSWGAQWHWTFCPVPLWSIYQGSKLSARVFSWVKTTCLSVGQNDQLKSIATMHHPLYRGRRWYIWNQVIKMITWSSSCGRIQNESNHFIIVKDCVYSAFWAFRYVRAYGGWCVHSGGRWTFQYSGKSTDKICPLIFSHLPRTSAVQDQVDILSTPTSAIWSFLG